MHIALRATVLTNEQINIALVYLAGAIGLVIVISLVLLALRPLITLAQEKLELDKALTGPLTWAGLLWAGLFSLLLAGLVWTLFGLFQQVTLRANGASPELRGYLWTITAVTATLGAVVALPFTIIRTSLNARQTKNAEEGLITERITKAVEGLGAEKEVSAIGRPVILRNIDPEYDDDPTVSDPSDTQTVIEWQGKPVQVPTGKMVSKEGDWQVFNETLPNIEVRIGAIYALERIAQDSDRDHVQIMEILCAYIRENAPGKEAEPWPEIDMDGIQPDGPLPDDWEERVQTFEKKHKEKKEKVVVREDIQTALKVIGRRSEKQRGLEAKNNDPESKEIFVFDEEAPNPDAYFDANTGAPRPGKDHGKALSEWTERIEAYTGYRLDLRGANLRGYDLTGYNLAGAQLGGAQMQGAWLYMAQMQGALLDEARMQGAWLYMAQMQGARLYMAQMQGARLDEARMQGARLHGARMDNRTSLTQATLAGACVREVDETTIAQLKDFWEQMFGDATALPPEVEDRPAHWPDFEMEIEEFYEAWGAWQADPDGFRSPRNPEADTDDPPAA